MTTGREVLFRLPAQRVSYTFVSVHRVVGFTSIPEGVSASIELTSHDASARLIADPASDARPLYERGAIAEMLMRAVFNGEASGADLQSSINEKIAKAEAERKKAHPDPAVFLVITALGTSSSQDCDARDIGLGVLAIDAVNKKELASRHRSIVSTVTTATSLAIAPITHALMKVVEGVYTTLLDGRPLYSISFEMGSAEAYLSRPVNSSDASTIQDLANKLMSHAELESPIRLLADSAMRPGDRLERFILSWAAMEMIVKKNTAGCQQGKWVAQVPAPFRAAAEKLHSDYLIGGHKNYGLTDRIRVLAMMKNLAGYELIARQVNSIRKARREPLFHEGVLEESALPVEELTALVHRLLALCLNAT